MPKNSPIVDINQFSGDFRFTDPPEQGTSHNSPRPGPPWHLALSNAWSAGLRSRRPSLRPSRSTKRWESCACTATTSATLVPRRLGAQGVQEKKPVGKEMARSRSDVFLGWGLGETFGFGVGCVGPFLMACWEEFEKIWWADRGGVNAVGSLDKTSFAFLPLFAEESLRAFPKPPVWQS